MNEEQLNKILDRQFAALAGHMSRRFDELEAKIDAKADRKQVESLHGAVDSLAGDVRDIKVELGAIGVQLDRHDQVIRQLADHTGVQLQYE